MRLLGEQKIERTIFVGTSRGGLLTMALASAIPQAIAGAVLNDIGPVLDPAGLLRIKGYVGKIPPPRSWQEAVASLKRIMGTQFPAFSEQDWRDYARRTWNDDFSPRSDPALATIFEGIDDAGPLPSLWPQFDALAQAVPVLVLRGEHSDLLSRETVDEMQRRGRQVEAVEVVGEGHAPGIERPETVARILRFMENCDRSAS
jgi:pimeloyl-ACP methyl ester carboxylesterase